MTIASIAPVVDENGISVPSLEEVIDFLQSQYRQIFGADIYLEADSQDGEWLSVLAAAINDTNAAAVAIYNGFSPATAAGNGLSSVVKINGLSRAVPTRSTVDLTVGGTVGTTINNGIVRDSAGYRWDLPAQTVIGSSGVTVVTATCEADGAVVAGAGTVNQIVTPTRGWQSVTNTSAAAPGNPVESDGRLRQRQSVSVQLPARSVLAGISAGINAVPGVTRYRVYENASGSADENGIPAHAIAAVVEGGDAKLIATVIADKKTPGTPTDGDTSISVENDSHDMLSPIKFYRPAIRQISVTVHLTPLEGYLSTIGDAIKKEISDYINQLGIGQTVYDRRLQIPAQLDGDPRSYTYDITSLSIAADGGDSSTDNVPIAFNEIPMCSPSDVNLVIDSDD